MLELRKYVEIRRQGTEDRKQRKSVSAFCRPSSLFRRKGFTLLELMVSAAILVITLAALLATYISLAALIESSRNTTTAINDANRVIEQMRNSAATSFNAMLSTNWTSWAASNGADTLSGEQVATCYYTLNGTLVFCGNGSTTNNPVQARVNVSWSERNHARSEQIVTLVTNRQ